jgi:hypothetical protein
MMYPLNGPVFGFDLPGAACSFESNACSHSMLGHGGFDEHHEWPKHLGGYPNQETMLILCPNHHRRQHSLVRYLIEFHEAGTEPAWSVEQHFVKAERDAARYAVSRWVADPTAPHPVRYWTSPAARDV